MLISQINTGTGAEEPLKWAGAGAKKEPGSGCVVRCPAVWRWRFACSRLCCRSPFTDML